MFYRKVIKYMSEWSMKTDRKPLILRGARQVGKTTAINLFSKQFDNYIYLNLEKFEDRELFNEKLSIKEIFQSVLLVKGITLKKGRTLIFIDEIQNSNIAIKMLRYFYEELKDIFVISAGSLLELMLEKGNISFPVGRVEYMYMYPCSFFEFLEANNQNNISNEITKLKVNSILHNKISKLFRQYTLIGGMPEIINKYINNDNIISLNPIYESLFTAYLDDSEKYSKNEKNKKIIRFCLDNIPAETGNRIKYTGFGKSNYKSSDISEALHIIEKAMLINIIHPTTSIALPIVEDRKKSPKLQFFDTGLLNYFIGLQIYFIKIEDLNSIYRGVIAEHIVRQEITAIDINSNSNLLFWVREKKQSNSEVDIVLQFKGKIIPVEVKSGKTGTLRSLHQFIDLTGSKYAVRFYNEEYKIISTATPKGNEYILINLPFYYAGMIYEILEKEI
ncbi:MAG: AAA family ATPase [Candidatus Delongbacteria bacterium]|jgi:predicted AAA+ superfamily ATPase|nr:AAA family ATPase [Candidatus Delongbacteria bacterium]